MWNSLCTIWRTLNIVLSILTALILLYFAYSISPDTFRFTFWRPAPVVNGNAAKQHENLVDDDVFQKRAP